MHQKIKNIYQKIIKRKSYRDSFFMKNNPIYKKYDIGIYTYGKPKILDWEQGATLKIGKFCSIAADVKIILGGNHRYDWITTYPLNKIFGVFPKIHEIASKGDVIIGNDVWIGNGAIILSGIEIGDGAVIGAGAVVTKNVEPYTIVAGNPAKELKKRFDSNTIQKLREIEWWNWDIEKIKQNIEILQTNRVDKILIINNKNE